jgi:hypothetical protein
MKNAIKIFTISALIGLLACDDADQVKPVPATGPSSYSAKFLFMNASPDAPSLDMYVNNVKTGASLTTGTSHASYNTVAVSNNAVITAAANTTASVSSGLSANTNIRSKASTGTIGGTLGSSDLIFRAGNNNSNNFLAVNGASYTVFVVDTITRPKPVRKLNASLFGDTTFFNPLTGSYLSTVERAALSAAVKAKLVSIGTVPLGSSDPGGVRYLVVTDEWPLPSTLRLPAPAASRFAARFINLSPDAGTVTASINATSLASGLFSYPFIQSNFNPSVGSRISAGTTPVIANFANNFGGLVPGTYTIATNTTAASLPFDFIDGGIYTIVLTGKKNNGTLTLSVIKHN